MYRNYTETRDGTIDGKPNYRTVSNILNVTRKIFNSGILDVFSDIHDCCCIAKKSNWDALTTPSLKFPFNFRYDVVNASQFDSFRNTI